MKTLWLIFIIFLVFTTDNFAQSGNSALFFDGSNDYVDCSGDTTLDLQGEFTLQTWIRGDVSNNSYARILDKFNFFTRQGYNIVRQPSSNSFMLDFFTTENTKHAAGGTTVVFDNQWHFVTATCTGDTIRIYVDGNIENLSVIDNKVVRQCSYTFKIGNGFDGNIWFPYRGYIDEARVWKTALDSNMVRDWMHRQVTSDHPKYDQMVGYWKFDEGEGSKTDDDSPKDNHGLLINMDTTTSWFDSSVPLASETTEDLENITAIWAGKDSAHSSVFALKGTEIKDDGYIIFGHNGQELDWIDTDVPGHLNIQSRLKRIWRVELSDTISANILFDVSDLGLDGIGNFTVLVNTAPVFANADTFNGEFNKHNMTYTVSYHEINSGYYYTLASDENLTRLDNKSSTVIPQNFALYQNYPNPFNPATTINYELPITNYVELNIYNLLGQKIETLVSERQPAGRYNVEWRADRIASGMYIYHIKTDHWQAVRKIVLLR